MLFLAICNINVCAPSSTNLRLLPSDLICFESFSLLFFSFCQKRRAYLRSTRSRGGSATIWQRRGPQKIPFLQLRFSEICYQRPLLPGGGNWRRRGCLGLAKIPCHQPIRFQLAEVFKTLNQPPRDGTFFFEIWKNYVGFFGF
jgi:hypothetical protein